MEYEIYGYNVPFTASSPRRPVFTTHEARQAFLNACAVGLLVSADDADGYEFNPRQSVLTITEGAFGSGVALTDATLIKINYLKVKITTRTGPTSAQAQEYFYFVDSLQGFSPQFEAERRTASFNISFDAFAMALNPIAPPRLCVGSVVQISSIFDGIYGARKEDTPAASFPLLNAGDTANTTRANIIRSAGADFGGGEQTLDNAYMFVGIFSRVFKFGEEANAGAVVLARPLDYFDGRAGLNLPLEELVSVSKITRCNVQRDSFTRLIFQNDPTEKEIEVKLLRAFIIPRALLPQNEVWDSAPLGGEDYVEYQKGFCATGIVGEWWLDNQVNPPSYEGRAFIEIPTNAAKELSAAVPFLSYTFDAQSARAVYVDIGTASTRLQIPAPAAYRMSASASASVRFLSSFNLSGFNLIMSAGDRQVNLGGDFEIPVPYNEGAASVERDKWSVALQGVSQVGGIVAGVATQNPLLIGGAILSAGQFAAGIAERYAQQAVVQGQGNGELTTAAGRLPAQNATKRGAIYARYILETDAERLQVALFGYKWACAFVDNEEDAARSIFGNENADGATIRYIKTTGAAFSITPRAIAQTEDLNERLSKLFDRGLWLFYNPTNAEDMLQ